MESKSVNRASLDLEQKIYIQITAGPSLHADDDVPAYSVLRGE